MNDRSKARDSVVAARGGSFLLEDRLPDEVFTPEDLSDEQRMIGQTCQQWLHGDVLPRLAEIQARRAETVRALMRRGGDLGLLGIEIPEAYGGLGLDKVSSAVVTENIAGDGSFAVTYSAHTGIGTLPIVYFGTEAQKRKYLPKLASGEWIGSYSLSEASSASDALNAKARAVASPDGKSWILNGEKMWLTNAGYADVYTTFAKVDGEHFTAFIIEKGMPGVSLGAEEKKTGLKGSSTRPLILSDAVIPRENLLGQVGKGHKIAFNILNVGRWKLGAAVTGGAKWSMAEAIAYAKNRQAFGRSVSDFGLVRQKIAEMAIRTYVAESMVYRTGGMVDRNVAKLEGDGADATAHVRGIEEYDVESSIVKVWCSEMLAYVVDEVVQIFGGAGFVEDYPAERHWRDARVYRIFEGTNEINRLLVPGRLLRRALKGELNLLDKVTQLTAELENDRKLPAPSPGYLGDVAQMVAGAKKIALVGLGLAVRRFGQELTDQQEVLGDFADIAMDVYGLESALLRTQKLASGAGGERARLQEAAVRCFADDALDRIASRGRRLLAAVEENEARLATHLDTFHRLATRPALNSVALRRLIAAAAVEAGGYPLTAGA
jgi:alkylation response protein AidB-like acyl-CoA dehydrogenase